MKHKRVIIAILTGLCSVACALGVGRSHRSVGPHVEVKGEVAAGEKMQITGTWMNVKNRPVLGVVVVVSAETDKEITNVMTDDAGNFAFHDLLPATYKVYFIAASTGSSKPVTVSRGQILHIDYVSEEQITELMT